VRLFVQLLQLHIVVKVKIIWHITDVLVLVIVLTTVLIKYVVLTGSCTKNSEFDYHMNDDLGRMVLNPDVNVRSRGVMENVQCVFK
jgi:hypothetical protein